MTMTTGLLMNDIKDIRDRLLKNSPYKNLSDKEVMAYACGILDMYCEFKKMFELETVSK